MSIVIFILKLVNKFLSNTFHCNNVLDNRKDTREIVILASLATDNLVSLTYETVKEENVTLLLCVMNKLFSKNSP